MVKEAAYCATWGVFLAIGSIILVGAIMMFGCCGGCTFFAAKVADETNKDLERIRRKAEAEREAAERREKATRSVPVTLPDHTADLDDDAPPESTTPTPRKATELSPSVEPRTKVDEPKPDPKPIEIPVPKKDPLRKVESTGPTTVEERKATGKLRLAKQYLDSGKNDSAKRWLQDTIKEYPGTKAAAEASELLKGLK